MHAFCGGNARRRPRRSRTCLKRREPNTPTMPFQDVRLQEETRDVLPCHSTINGPSLQAGTRYGDSEEQRKRKQLPSIAPATIYDQPFVKKNNGNAVQRVGCLFWSVRPPASHRRWALPTFGRPTSASWTDSSASSPSGTRPLVDLASASA